MEGLILKMKNTAIAMGLGAISALGITFLMSNKKVQKKTKKMVNGAVNNIEKKYEDFM